MTTINPRSIQDEGPFLPDSIDDLIELRERVVEAGHPEYVANGLVGWLIGKKGGGAGVVSSATKAKYRRILRDLGEGNDRTGHAQGRPDPSSSPAGDGRVTAGQRRRGQGQRERDLVPVASEDGPDTGEAPIISVM